MRFRLLRCLARAVVKHGGKLLFGLVPGGEAVYDIATDTWEDYRRGGQEGALRAEVQDLAQAPAEEVQQEVRAAVQAEAAGLPADAQQKVAAYLTQVPAMIRRSLRPHSGPAGAAVPPPLSLSRPDDLVPLLPPRPPRFQPGDRPPGIGDWELEELLGVGGFGEVWKARHAHLKSKAPVALKFCLDRSAVPALRNEAGLLDRVMQRGRHPGVVALLQTYLNADPPCLEYEYVEGGDLAALIQEMHARGRLKPGTANRLLLHLAKVVAPFHGADPPIVHGDLKPANVLVQRDESGRVKLRVTDFGIGGLAAARAAREARQPTRSRQELVTDAVRGAYTPLYASPQQMRGEPADPRDDVHALGVIWYQLLTGDLRMVSKPTEWREVVEGLGLGEDLVQLLGACIANEAGRRPATAVALVEKMKAALLWAEKGKQDTQELEADLRECERIMLTTGSSEPFLREAASRRASAWIAAAERGSVGGQWLLGLCLAFGQGVAQDYAEALRWFRRAADQGYAAAQNSIGWMYRGGLGVGRDHTEELRWYRLAAGQGYAIAQHNIGCMYRDGEGVPQDFAEAARWFRRAADQHFAIAQSNLGLMYRQGLGVKQDLAEALRWFRRAADQGDAGAQSNIGWMYQKGLGVPPAYADAMRWYRSAAGQGNVLSQNTIGWMYLEGLGVPQDRAEALRWFRKAADQGDALARYAIGCMYKEGLGVKQDDGEALRWFRLAAGQGFAPAQNAIGMMPWYCLEGLLDEAEALRWFRLAADQGDAFAIACMYNGEDRFEALRLFRKAADQGLAIIKYEIEKLRGQGQE
jgi:TPR repeat protein